MYIDSQTDKNVSPSDTLAWIVGKIVIATKNNGFRFASRLVEVRGDGTEQELWFQNKNGLRWMTRRSNISDIREIREQ